MNNKALAIIIVEIMATLNATLSNSRNFLTLRIVMYLRNEAYTKIQPETDGNA